MFKTFKGYFKGKKSLKFSQGGQPFDRYNFENAMDAALDDTLMPRQRAQRLEDVSVFLSQSVFKYGNLKDLAWTRDIMMELWRSILSLMNMQGERLPGETRQACNKCLLGIIKRKEFRLEIMGFNTEQITIEKNDEPVWRRFYSLLRNTFVYCVRRINQVENLACSVGSDRSVTRGLTYNQDYVAGELVFCSEIMAIAYFRVPGVTVHIVTRIRQMLLLKKPEFLKSEDDQIKNPNGWKAHTKGSSIPKAMRLFTSNMSRRSSVSIMRNITKQAEERVQDTKFAEQNPSLFFWQYTCDYNDDDDVEQCFGIGRTAWLDKLTLSGFFYAAFLQSWMGHVRDTVGDDVPIRFGTLPGFLILLKLYICLLEERYLNELDHCVKSISGPVPELSIENGLGLDMDTGPSRRFVTDTARASAAVIKVSREMLYVCPHLLNIWLALAIENTNIHHCKCVETCMNDISEWLKCIRSSNAKVEIVEKSLLPKALQLLAKHEHHRQLLSSLRFIYANELLLNELKIDIRGEVFEECLLRPAVFFKFFLHWEYTVRITFCHLLVYRLFVVPRQELNLGSDLSFIAKNVLEVVRFRSKSVQADRHPSYGTDQRLAGLLEGNLSSVRHVLSGNTGPCGVPDNLRIYCSKAFYDYRKVVEEYYRRAVSSGDGVVSGPQVVNVEINTIDQCQRLAEITASKH